jgi:hypothetical protein
MDNASGKIRINRASVLTLWAAPGSTTSTAS